MSYELKGAIAQSLRVVIDEVSIGNPKILSFIWDSRKLKKSWRGPELWIKLYQRALFGRQSEYIFII